MKWYVSSSNSLGNLSVELKVKVLPFYFFIDRGRWDFLVKCCLSSLFFLWVHVKPTLIYGRHSDWVLYTSLFYLTHSSSFNLNSRPSPSVIPFRSVKRDPWDLDESLNFMVHVSIDSDSTPDFRPSYKMSRPTLRQPEYHKNGRTLGRILHWRERRCEYHLPPYKRFLYLIFQDLSSRRPRHFPHL